MSNNGVKTQRLVEERQKKNLYQKDMARLMGYRSPTTYMNIERGDTKPTLDVMNKISQILGKPVDYFFEIRNH